MVRGKPHQRICPTNFLRRPRLIDTLCVIVDRHTSLRTSHRCERPILFDTTCNNVPKGSGPRVQGKPVSIICDRDPKILASNYLESLQRVLWNKLNLDMSTALPSANRRAKREEPFKLSRIMFASLCIDYGKVGLKLEKLKYLSRTDAKKPTEKHHSEQAKEASCS
ncbi:hypothetical protein Tco_0367294 [Tanacetum coccineum]